MLRYFINKALGKWNIWKPEVMVSVPAGVTSTERRAVIEAAIKLVQKCICCERANSLLLALEFLYKRQLDI